MRKIEIDAPNDLPRLFDTVAVHEVQSCVMALKVQAGDFRLRAPDLG